MLHVSGCAGVPPGRGGETGPIDPGRIATRLAHRNTPREGIAAIVNQPLGKRRFMRARAA
nr:hypothetical protein [Sphingomonas sp. H160509]